jgi:hypothetical protein
VFDDQVYADFEPFKNHSPDISTPNMNRLADAGMVLYRLTHQLRYAVLQELD